MAEVGPAVARERLRTRLRELRDQLKLPADEVARRMYWSLSKLNRVETGTVTIQPMELRGLLELYGVRDQEEVSALVDLAVVSRRRQWWSNHRLKGDFQQFVAYEAEAATISVCQGLLVPGLLQTPAYARAITSRILRRDASDPDVDETVKIRLKRQRAVLERATPPRIVAMLDESVLRRPVGGHATMRDQLDRLAALAEQPNMTIGFIPFEAGAHPGQGGIFELLEFEDANDPAVLFVESAASDRIEKDPDQIQEYREIIEDLIRSGVTGNEAAGFIRKIQETLDLSAN